jgi:hypothetical protein
LASIGPTPCKGHQRRALLGGVVLPLARVLSANKAVILAASQFLFGTGDFYPP